MCVCFVFWGGASPKNGPAHTSPELDGFPYFGETFRFCSCMRHEDSSPVSTGGRGFSSAAGSPEGPGLRWHSPNFLRSSWGRRSLSRPCSFLFTKLELARASCKSQDQRDQNRLVLWSLRGLTLSRAGAHELRVKPSFFEGAEFCKDMLSKPATGVCL